MPCLSEKLQLALDTQVAWIRVVDRFDTLDNLLYVLLDHTLRPQVTLIVELWVTNVAYVLHKVLSKTVSQSFHIRIVPQLFHHLAPHFES